MVGCFCWDFVYYDWVNVFNGGVVKDGGKVYVVYCFIGVVVDELFDIFDYLNGSVNDFGKGEFVF